MPKSRTDKILELQAIIRQLEKYPIRGVSGKKERQELQTLLREEQLENS